MFPQFFHSGVQDLSEKIRSSERTLARQTQKVLNHLQVTAINYMSNVNIFVLDHISYKEPVWRFNVYRS
jgi:hypothetical protein